ncbi:MAG: MFS transporter [Sandaracinaceae bacterium]|nr:MFS transporter [Sandaracinaceae bacterium]
MLVIMDSTIVNVAIPSIVRNFGATFRDAEWVNTIYSLVYAATLILWGKIGDQYGRRLLFLIGVALFGLGSALVGASSSITMLIAMRALQGIGAAILSPSTLSIVTTTFRGKERGIAFGVWGATAGVAAALGPLLGGWVIDHATWMVDDFGSWRWAFYINIPIVIAARSLAVCGPSANRAMSTRGIISTSWALWSAGWDWPRSYSGSSRGRGMGGGNPVMCSPFSVGNGLRKAFPIVPISIVTGVILLAIFTWYRTAAGTPGNRAAVRVWPAEVPSFRYGMITGLIVNLGEIGILFAITLFLQGTKGLSAFDTGVALLPLAAMAFVGAPLAGAFSQRLGPKWIVTTGMVLEVFALLALSIIIDGGGGGGGATRGGGGEGEGRRGGRGRGGEGGGFLTRTKEGGNFYMNTDPYKAHPILRGVGGNQSSPRFLRGHLHRGRAVFC